MDGRPAADAAGGTQGSGVGSGDSPPPSPLSGAKRSCMRRSSTSAGAGGEAGKRCAADGGSAQPVAALAVGGARGSEPYALPLRNEWGREFMQWYGCCGGCDRAHVPVEDMGGVWVCEECVQAQCSRMLWEA